MNSETLLKGLIRKGFVQKKKNRNQDHIYLHFISENGKETPIFTKISHGKKEYKDFLFSAVKKQLCLNSNKQLEDLVQCPLSRQEYEVILKTKGIL